METVWRAADELLQIHSKLLPFSLNKILHEWLLIIERGADCREALSHFFKVYSTAFYLKVAFCAGLRLPWSAVANSINVLKTDVPHKQVFMAQVTSTKGISWTVDSATAIAMPSKLAYQLSKLSAR